MSILSIPTTERTPKLPFDIAGNVFSLMGEASPGYHAAPYGEGVGKPTERLSAQASQKISCRYALPCFDSSVASSGASSDTRPGMDLPSLLEQAAGDGNDDLSIRACGVGDHMRERGEAFAKGLDAAKFELQFLEWP